MADSMGISGDLKRTPLRLLTHYIVAPPHSIVAARKRSGSSTWTMRVHASSGALYPIETHLVLPGGLVHTNGGVYHYDVDGHQLERRADIDLRNSGLPTGVSDVCWERLHCVVPERLAVECLVGGECVAVRVICGHPRSLSCFW